MERLVQRQLFAWLLDQEHGNAAAIVARQNDTVPVKQETFHTRSVRRVRSVEWSGQIFTGKQRPDQLEQHGRAHQEPFDASQPAGSRRVQRKLTQLSTTPGNNYYL